MITLEKMAYDIRRLLNKLNLTDEVIDAHLYDKIVQYIELIEQTIYSKTKVIDDAWNINLGKVTTTNSNSGDDPKTSNGSVVFSKYVLPRLILFGNKPYLRVSSGLRSIDYSFIESFDLFYQIYRGDKEILDRNPCYVLDDNTVYAYPNRLGLSITLVPADVRDCTIKRALINPISNQLVYSATEERKFTIWDELPISGSVVQMVVLELLTKEFNASREQAVDATQNGTDEV